MARLRSVLFAAAFSAVLVGGVAMAVEEPVYNSVLQDGAFELRDYPPLIVAEVTVSGTQRQAAYKGFRLLASYIFGANTPHQDVATASQGPKSDGGEKIAMTAPVTQTASAGHWLVRFTMPAIYTLDTLPPPKNPDVRLESLPAQRFAVLRFSGLAGEGEVSAKSRELIAAIKTRKLRQIGGLSLAQYDPPWTLWFMRRNEVMAPVAP